MLEDRSNFPISQDILTAPLLTEPFKHASTRRNLGKRTVIALGVLSGSSCGSPALCIPESPTGERRNCFTGEVAPLATKAELRSIIQGLPDSPYKSFVLKHAIPLLADRTPSGVEVAGLWISVADLQVKTNPTSKDIGGSLNPNVHMKAPKYSLEKQTFIATLPYLLKDRVVELPVDHSPEAEFSTGIEPEITFRYPGNLILRNNREVENYKNLRYSVLLKESFSLAWAMAYLSAMITHAKERGLPLSVKYHGQNLEAISHSFTLAGTLKGKLSALLDIGGFILHAKAIQSNKPVIEEMKKQPAYASILEVISQKDFGSGSGDMLANLSEFIDANRKLFDGQKWYVGDLDKLP